MKTLTIDYETYLKELSEQNEVGYKAGFRVARDIIIELLNGATTEKIIENFGDETLLSEKFIDEMAAQIEQAILRGKCK
jgi:hypothetical protein